MIAFDLECTNGHCFEGWFEDLLSFDHQRENGLISCPYCDNRNVARLMSTFSTKRVSSEIDSEKVVKDIQKYVYKNFDDVGTDFAKEALKMHYGVGEHRNLRGVSSPEEEKIMKSAGIRFFKLMLPPGVRESD